MILLDRPGDMFPAYELRTEEHKRISRTRNMSLALLAALAHALLLAVLYLVRGRAGRERTEEA